MGLITKFKMSFADKRIMQALKGSNWYRRNRDANRFEMSIDSIDVSEDWVRGVTGFAALVVNDPACRTRLDAAGLGACDVANIFFLMTIITLPNPVFKTGHSNAGITLVGSAMYQEPETQLEECLSMIRTTSSGPEAALHNCIYARAVMNYAIMLKGKHDMVYGVASW